MAIFFYESVTHTDSHVTATLILCVTPSDGGKSTHTTWHALCQGISLLGRTAVRGTARHNFSTVELGSSISQIQTPIWSQKCSMGFRSGLNLHMHVLCGAWHFPGHIVSSKCTRRLGKHTIAEKPDVALGVEVPSNTTSSLRSQWWMVPHTMTEGERLPFMGWKYVPLSLSFACAHMSTTTIPSLWNSITEDRVLQCLRSHRLPHTPNPHLPTWGTSISVSPDAVLSELTGIHHSLD